MNRERLWPLFRLIIPTFPEENIFTPASKSITALGAVMVATAATKAWGWRVEVIDENNFNGSCDKNGLPDHKKLQEESSASVVGFYCGLTSTIERVWGLADFYRQEGAKLIFGGWHAHYRPEDLLVTEDDIVVHGDGEIAIQEILLAIRSKAETALRDFPGISFLEDGKIYTNEPKMLEVPDLNDLPFPDFNLIRFANVSTYPIGRTRGCRMNCEFCSVKGKPRSSCAEYFFEEVKWLVEKRKAKNFFIVDDRIEEDLDEISKFFCMIAERYNNKLRFTVQIRLETAYMHSEFLRIMKKAGVRMVCIGYESPIEADLKTMRKGYSSAKMIEWTKIYRDMGFQILGMFIVGYPLKEGVQKIPSKEIIKHFKDFIHKAKIDFVQPLLPVPLVGTELRQRLEEEGRIYPLEVVSWSKYDGKYICFEPDNMTVREFQELQIKIMHWFYGRLYWRWFPIKIFSKVATTPYNFLVQGKDRWQSGLWRELVMYKAHNIIKKVEKRIKKRGEDRRYIEGLENYSKTKRQS